MKANQWIENTQINPLKPDLVEMIHNYQMKALKNSVDACDEFYNHGIF